jgi:ribonuclease BN (tRNA processing enzyme)
LEIKFIGTGSGKTSVKRYHSSFIISENYYNLLVDAGDGIAKALLCQKIAFNSINGIIISHLHPDHFSGLSGLIVQMKITGRTGRLDIFVHESLIEVVKDFIYHSYVFSEKMDFSINYVPFYNQKPFPITENFQITAKQNNHLESYRIYDRSNLLSFSCSSFLFTLHGLNVQYTGDIGNDDDVELFKEHAIHTLISESSHISIENLLLISEKLKIKKLVFTHISDEDEASVLNLENINNGNNTFEIVAAYDGLTISV